MKKPNQPQLGDVVSCTWLDAHANATADYSHDEVQQATSYTMTTFGLLVRDDRGKIVNDPIVAVAAEVGEDRRYRGVTYIPATLVTTVTLIKAVGKRIIPKSAAPPTSPAIV